MSGKLKAQAGIGTNAIRLAKANADIIQISGHDGGTGASLLLPIKPAGEAGKLGRATVFSQQKLQRSGPFSDVCDHMPSAQTAIPLGTTRHH